MQNSTVIVRKKDGSVTSGKKVQNRHDAALVCAIKTTDVSAQKAQVSRELKRTPEIDKANNCFVDKRTLPKNKRKASHRVARCFGPQSLKSSWGKFDTIYRRSYTVHEDKKAISLPKYYNRSSYTSRFTARCGKIAMPRRQSAKFCHISCVSMRP